MPGRYCKQHDWYAQDGVCRWCEPPMTASELRSRVQPCQCGVYLFDMREYINMALEKQVGDILHRAHGPCYFQRPELIEAYERLLGDPPKR